MLSQFTCLKKKKQTGRFTSGQIYKSFINYIFHLDTLVYRNSRITILHCNIHQETGKRLFHTPNPPSASQLSFGYYDVKPANHQQLCRLDIFSHFSCAVMLQRTSVHSQQNTHSNLWFALIKPRGNIQTAGGTKENAERTDTKPEVKLHL